MGWERVQVRVGSRWWAQDSMDKMVQESVQVRQHTQDGTCEAAQGRVQARWCRRGCRQGLA